MLRLVILIAFVCIGSILPAQNEAQVIVLHDNVGTSIDSTEKAKYHLFTFWSAQQFDHAEFLMDADSSLSIRGTMKNGNVFTLPCTKKEFDQYNFQVRYYSGQVPKQELSENGFDSLGAGIVGLINCGVAFFAWRQNRER